MFCEHNFSSSSSNSDWRVSNLFDRTDADWIWRSFRPIMLSLDLILLYLQKTHFWIQTIYLLNAISSGGEIFYPESSQKCIYTSSKFWFHLFSVQESNPAYSLVSYRIGISIHYVYFVLEVQLSLRWNAHNHKSGAFSHVLDDVCLPERMVHFRLLNFTSSRNDALVRIYNEGSVRGKLFQMPRWCTIGGHGFTVNYIKLGIFLTYYIEFAFFGNFYHHNSKLPWSLIIIFFILIRSWFCNSIISPRYIFWRAKKGPPWLFCGRY